MRFGRLLPVLAFAALALAPAAHAGDDSVRAVAARFQALGLKPGPKGAYLQTIQTVEQSLVPGRSQVVLADPGGRRPVVLGDAFRPDLAAPLPKKVEAPMVFVGYGLDAPGAGIDDFAGRDLRGAVLVAVEGAPQSLSFADAARARAARTAAAVKRAGALGLITISTDRPADVGVYPSGDRGEAFQARLDPSRADALFVGSGYSFEEVRGWATAGRRIAGFRLAQSFRARFAVRARRVEQAAAVAMIGGPGDAPETPFVVAVGEAESDGARLTELAVRLKDFGSTARPILILALPEGEFATRGAALASGLRSVRVAAAVVLSATSPGLVAHRPGESSLAAAAERLGRLHRLELEAPPPLDIGGFAPSGAPTLALALPVSGSADGFSGFLAELVHETAAATEKPSWRPGDIFAQPSRRTDEIDDFRLQMPISLKRVRPPRGQA